MRWGIWRPVGFAAIAALVGADAAYAQTRAVDRRRPLPSPFIAADDAKVRAQEHLDCGNALKNERSFDKALVEFRAAHDLYPSPKIFYNEADAESELGHFVDAASHYDAFLREFKEPEDDEDAQRIQAAKEGAVAARAKIAIIEPDVPSGVEVLVDARSFGRTPLAEPVRVDPGHHRRHLSPRWRGRFPSRGIAVARTAAAPGTDRRPLRLAFAGAIAATALQATLAPLALLGRGRRRGPGWRRDGLYRELLFFPVLSDGRVLHPR